MSNKRFTTLSFLLIAFFTSCVGFGDAHKVSPDIGGAVAPANQQGQGAVTRVDVLISGLHSSVEGDRETAKDGLIAFASQSLESRHAVIEGLLKVVNVQGGCSELRTPPVRIYAWKEAADILGALRATEAIDTLINYSNCSYGPSGLGPGRYPATLALIKIEDVAIPKLADALERKPPEIQFRAAQALYSIGGERAKEVLTNALLKEKNKGMAYEIKRLLRDWKHSGTYKP